MALNKPLMAYAIFVLYTLGTIRRKRVIVTCVGTDAGLGVEKGVQAAKNRTMIMAVCRGCIPRLYFQFMRII